MKRLLFFLLMLSALSASAQDSVVYAEDESCGCEVVFVDGIQTTQEGDFYGFKRADGTVIAPNKYRYVDRFVGNYCRVWMDYEQAGLLNRQGVEVVPCRYHEVSLPSEGLIRVQDGDLYGFFDTLGSYRIPFRFRAASGFSEGLAVVAVDVDSLLTAYGYIDTLGSLAIAPDFEYAFPFSEDFAVVRKYDRYGMIDRRGREVLTFKFDVVTAMYEGTFMAGYEETGIRLYGRDMKPIGDSVYQAFVARSPNRLLVVKGGKAGFIDNRGRQVIPCRFDECGVFNDGATVAMKDGKWGIIDTLGREILPLQFDNSRYRGEAYRYHDGYALIESNGHYGFVDTVGNIIYPSFDDAYQFTDGLAPVKSNGRWGYLNTQGDVFLPFVFDLASPFHWGRAEVFWHGLQFDIDNKGKCVRRCSEAPESWNE